MPASAAATVQVEGVNDLAVNGTARALLILRSRPVIAAMALVVGPLGACSGRVPDVAFESVDYDVVECRPGAPDGSDCLRVTAPVVGEGTGNGSCAVYAAGVEENLAKVADSGELKLEAGDTITWEVAVRRSDHPDFRRWNPVCKPMIEG